MEIYSSCIVIAFDWSQKLSKYGDPQLSQQKQNTHSNSKLITTTTNSSHQNQIAHSTNKMLTAQTKTLTAQTKILTAPRFIVPLSRSEEKGNHLPVVGEDLCRSSCFLTRVYSIFFWMHSIKYLSGILILHFIYITIIRSHVGKYKAIQHKLVTFCNSTNHQGAGGGAQDYLPTTEKRQS